MVILKDTFLILTAFSAGIVIAGAIFSFISTIGIVSRLAYTSKTRDYINIYENAIVFGGIFGALCLLFDIRLFLPNFLAIFLSLCTGVFIGCLAVCLAETVEAIPILTRRVRLHSGIRIFMTALATGKLIGCLLYFLVPGFHQR